MAVKISYNAKKPGDKPGAVQKVCSDCGEAGILIDAFAEWDEVEQEWVLQNIFENTICQSPQCDGGECSITDVPLTEWEESTSTVKL